MWRKNLILVFIFLIFSLWMPTNRIATQAESTTPSSGITTRVSVASDGTQGNDYSYDPSISADGRYVAFQSVADNLVSGDTNGIGDIFVHDMQTGITTRVSVASDGTQGNGDTYVPSAPSISADGRYIAFNSAASNLVNGDTNGVGDIFVHDMQTWITTRVSVASGGTQGNGDAYFLSISADGRYVAFDSTASNLVSGDTNGEPDVFVHDLQTGITTRGSVASDGAEGDGPSNYPSISADGRYLAFQSWTSNLVSGDTNGKPDVFIHDLQTGITTRVSVASDGTQGNNSSGTQSISADGRIVTFQSYSSNFVNGDTNGQPDIFVQDLQTGITTRVSVASDGTQGNGNYCYMPSISADGRYVAFYSDSSNLVSGDTNGQADVFVHDRQTHITKRVSISSNGIQGNNNSEIPSISANGRYVAFFSEADNLVSGDTNGYSDVFVHDRGSSGLPGDISGYVTDLSGNPISRVTVSSLIGYKTDTDYTGYYEFNNLPPGLFTITPSKEGYSFNPPWRSVDTSTTFANSAQVSHASADSQDFIGINDGGEPTPFLSLPVQVKSGMSEKEYFWFYASVDAYDDRENGRVSSWFDHKYPDYGANNQTGIWTYREKFVNELYKVYKDGLYCYKRGENGLQICYDGHPGYDFNSRLGGGNQPIFAAAAGNVVEAHTTDNGGYGEYVIIDHNNGYYTLYGHLSQIDVGLGAISAGTQIGLMGDTGNSTSNHLHFGVYRDDSAEIPVDPYGWSMGENDPWAEKANGAVSHWLWNYDKEVVLTNDGTGISGLTPDLRVNIEVTSAALSGQSVWQFISGIPSAILSGLRQLGVNFSITILEWFNGSTSLASMQGLGINKATLAEDSIILQASYENLDLHHLDEAKIVILQKGDSGEWQALSSTVITTTKIITATTSSTGDFSLMAPLLCPTDNSEPDDDTLSANVLPISGLTSIHVFDIAEDEDWFELSVIEGKEYHISAVEGSSVVTLQIELIATDSTTVLQSSAAEIIWTAPDNGQYYLRVSPTTGSAIGCDASYKLNIEGPQYIFLPILLK